MKTLMFFLMLLVPQGRTVTLTWNPNPENDIAGYILYYGKSSGNYQRSVSVAIPPAKVSVTGKTYFAVTAFDTQGLESDFSNEVHYP
jgi:hypothetical protein